MENVSYKSSVSRMVVKLLPEYQEFYGWGDAPGHPDLEHALDVSTTPQLDMFYALCKQNKVEELRQKIKELQSYQIRREA
jgi:hypothetical protein